MTWKCARIDRNPSKYFGTNYQSLKMCLKSCWNFLPSNLYLSESQVHRQKRKIYMTDKTMSDQVYILISDVPVYEPLVQWYNHRRWLGRPRFDSWEGQFFEISNFDSYDIFTCSGVYIDTFELKISQPPWFGGCRRWINDLAVVGSIPCRQNCGTWSTPWGELKWARLGQWSS